MRDFLDRFHDDDAAWWRLNVMTFHLLSVLKRVGLPGAFRDARPKRLRFWVFSVVGKVARHARSTVPRPEMRKRVGAGNLRKGLELSCGKLL